MAQLQIKIPYKPSWSRILFWVMCLMLPFWAIVAPATLGMMLVRIISRADTMPLSFAIGVSLSMVAFTLTSILLTALAEDNCIYISKDGIAFPPLFLPKLKFRRNKSWDELKGASVLGMQADNSSGGNLLLSFEDSSQLPLQLKMFKEKDLEQLFLALELWAVNCKRNPELVDYQKRIQNVASGAGTTGYTKMWEDEMRRRFSTTAFMPLEPEHLLQDGRLKIVRQLAFGGLSAIYLAQENKLDLVVLKEAVVPSGAEEQARKQAEQMLDKEADMLSKLEHPNIAKVMDHFVEDGRHYLVLQYINGPDLRQFVKENGAASLLQGLEWAIKIAEILKYLHAQEPPIIHRDLTPDNIVLYRNDLFLIDFGAANRFVGAATGTVVGKQAYIPPEQLRGKSVLQSDIYALGGSLYYLLTGVDPLPLAESSPSEKIADLPKQVDDLVRKCTAFEPEDRFQSAEELLEELKQCFGSCAQLNVAPIKGN